MTADLLAQVEVRLGDTAAGGPRGWVRYRDPETGTDSEWLDLMDFMERTAGRPEFKAARVEAQKRIRALEKERDAKASAPISERPAEDIDHQVKVGEDLTLLEKRDRLRAYLQQHPGTRLMDLKLHQDAERGPLFILAKKLLQRGELLEHPKTRALMIKGEQQPAGEDLERREISVRILEDLPAIRDSEGNDRRLFKGEIARLPDSTSRALIRKGAAEEVLESGEELEDAPTAELEASPAEVPAVHPAIAEGESINRMLKLAREKGEEAAVEAKREEEAHRVEAHETKQEEQRAEDEELLRSGGWWDVVNGAVDEFLAGEPMLRKVIVYSALSAGLSEGRLHLMAIGDSQVGKSYALRSIGSKLFPGIFIDVSSMSGKALYYAAKEANNSRYYDGKILLIDELADQSEATLDFMKAGMSSGATKLTNMTVDEHRKFSHQELEGLPIFWSTSAEVLEDAEGQIMNRPFVVNPDESTEQTQKIMDFQRDAASINLVKIIESKVPHARRLLESILEEKDLAVYNLFAQHVRISEDDARARNTLPMFFNLVAAVAYAHRFARPVIELPNGKRLLFATYQDNVEAAELWQWASGPKSTGLMNRHIELLKILPVFAGTITGGLDVDKIREIYTERTGRKVSHKSIRNYLAELSSKDKATYYEDEEGRHLYYSLGSSHTIPSASHLLVGIESLEGNKLLGEALKSLKSASSHLPTETQYRIAGLREDLLGKRSTAPDGRF